MKRPNSGPSSIARSTRRGFLKSTATSSALLAGVLGTDNALSNPAPGTSFRQCGFSLLPADFVYLNSGTEGSMPDCVISHFQDGLRRWAANPTHAYETDEASGKHQKLHREVVGQFFNVGKNNICLTDNTTMGMSMTLMGLNFQPKDRVVITNHEHNAIKSPLAVQRAKTGLQVIVQPFPSAAALRTMDSNELLDTLFPDTPALRGATALCVSHVYPATGVRLPLLALRQKADQLGIRYLIVDGAQAMGMLDLNSNADNVKHSSFYACPGHKWLNGPPSTGVLYLQNADIQPPEFYPTLSQRMGRYTDHNDRFPMAEALQVRGCSNTPGFAAMIMAMRFQQSLGGPAEIEKHILKLSRQIKDNILARSPSAVVSPHADTALLSGLTVFFPFNWNKPTELFTDKNTADRVVSELLKKNIQVRAIGFDNSADQSASPGLTYAIRVSTAIFNTAGQIEHFNRTLQKVLSKLA